MVKQHSTLKNTPGVNGPLSLPDASKQRVCGCTCLCGWKRGAGCAPLVIGIEPDQFNAMPCTRHSLLFELDPGWPLTRMAVEPGLATRKQGLQWRG